MTDVQITLDDITGPTTDEGGGEYEQYIGGDPAFLTGHDPFVDYPAGTVDQVSLASPFAVPLVAKFSAGLDAVAPHLAHNLTVRRANVWACWGSGVIVGWIGDASHQAECSDHNPDSTGVVHAIDVMVTGTRAHDVVAQCLAHSGDLQYVIHNGVIWSATVGWKPRTYTGSNKHTDHVHISGKHGEANADHDTCVGYDLAAQASTPLFDLCPAPKPPAPKPPVKPGTHTPGSRTLKSANPDMSGDDVVFVQRFIGPRHCGAADGHYGPNTISGVRWYQHMRGIHVTGVVDDLTWHQMGVKTS